MSSQPPEPEGDVTVNLTVEVTVFGRPDQVRREVVLQVARTLHHAFGPGRVRLKLGGQRILYDPLAHDGEHEGHDDVLLIELDHPEGGGRKIHRRM